MKFLKYLPLLFFGFIQAQEEIVHSIYWAAAASCLASPRFRYSLFAIHRLKPVASQKSSNKPLNHCRGHS
jgi:hypothetical protein